MRERPPVHLEIQYERHKLAVMGLLRGRCPWLAEDDREALYHDAYATLLEKHSDGTLDIEAMHDRQVRSYLMTAAIYRGLHEGTRHERKRTKPDANAGVLTPDPTLPVEERVAAASETAPDYVQEHNDGGEPDAGERWPWLTEVRGLLAVPLAQAPTLDDVGVDHDSMRQRSRKLLTADQLHALERALR